MALQVTTASTGIMQNIIQLFSDTRSKDQQGKAPPGSIFLRRNSYKSHSLIADFKEPGVYFSSILSYLLVAGPFSNTLSIYLSAFPMFFF